VYFIQSHLFTRQRDVQRVEDRLRDTAPSERRLGTVYWLENSSQMRCWTALLSAAVLATLMLLSTAWLPLTMPSVKGAVSTRMIRSTRREASMVGPDVTPLQQIWRQIKSSDPQKEEVLHT